MRAGTGPEQAFPVLVPGLFAVSGWDRGDAEQRDVVCLRYARLLRACRLADEEESALRHSWATAVEARLDADGDGAGGGGRERDADGGGPDGGGRGRDAVTAAVLTEYRVRHRPAAAREWYRDHLPRGADALDPLALLGEWFRQGGDYRHAAEQCLMAAFVHDVGASYGRLQRWNREPWPLILLDDAHHPAGQDFLDLLLAHRALPERPDHEELVVVATRLGDVPEGAADAVHRALPDLVKSSGWRRSGLGPAAGLLAVPLTPLSRDDILPLLVPDGPARPLHPYLASAVHS
ncbi:hypothetical protein NKH77_42045 [Streptomyces sp. M19]